MRPGKLDRRITIQVRVLAKELSGEDIETWSTDTSIGNNGVIWAQKLEAKGFEKYDANVKQVQSEMRFRIRYIPEITESEHRIVLADGRVYDIEDIDELGRRDGRMIYVTLQNAT